MPKQSTHTNISGAAPVITRQRDILDTEPPVLVTEYAPRENRIKYNFIPTGATIAQYHVFQKSSSLPTISIPLFK